MTVRCATCDDHGWHMSGGHPTGCYDCRTEASAASIDPLTCVECGGTGWVWHVHPVVVDADFASACESCDGKGLEPMQEED